MIHYQIAEQIAKSLEVVLSTSDEDFHRARKHYGQTNQLRLCAGRTSQIFASGKTVYLLGWFDEKISTLIHECVHIALFALEERNINPHTDDGEVMAHLTDRIFDRLYSPNTLRKSL